MSCNSYILDWSSLKQINAGQKSYGKKKSDGKLPNKLGVAVAAVVLLRPKLKPDEAAVVGAVPGVERRADAVVFAIPAPKENPVAWVVAVVPPAGAPKLKPGMMVQSVAQVGSLYIKSVKKNNK